MRAIEAAEVDQMAQLAALVELLDLVAHRLSLIHCSAIRHAATRSVLSRPDAAAQKAGAARVRELALRRDRGQRLVDGGDRQPVALAELCHERADRARDLRRAFAFGQADDELRGTPIAR